MIGIISGHPANKGIAATAVASRAICTFRRPIIAPEFGLQQNPATWMPFLPRQSFMISSAVIWFRFSGCFGQSEGTEVGKTQDGSDLAEDCQGSSKPDGQKVLKPILREAFMIRTVLSVATVFFALAFMLPVSSPAQQQQGTHGSMMGGSHGSMMGRDMSTNMMMMSEMMQEMQQKMSRGMMNPEHQKQMAEIMTKMGKIMSEMDGPDAMKLQEQHHKQLEDLDNQLDSMPK